MAQNFTVTDNLLTAASDYDPFSIAAPLDPRLPGGGGYIVAGLYNVTPSKASVSNDLRTYAPNYGTISQVYNGIDVNVNARMANGVQLQAGSSTGQRVTDYCDVRRKLPEQTGGFSTGSEVAGVQPGQPVLQRRAGYHDAVHRGRVPTRSRRSTSFLPARSRARPASRCGQLRGDERRRRRSRWAGPSPTTRRT